MIIPPIFTTSLIHFLLKGPENVLFELGSERVECCLLVRMLLFVCTNPNCSFPEVPLVLGPPQLLSVALCTGPGSVAECSVLEISSQSGLSFLPIPSGRAAVSSTLENQREETSRQYSLQAPPEPHGSEGMDRSVALVTLPECGPYEKVAFDVLVQAPLAGLSAQAGDVECTVRRKRNCENLRIWDRDDTAEIRFFAVRLLRF